MVDTIIREEYTKNGLEYDIHAFWYSPGIDNKKRKVKCQIEHPDTEHSEKVYTRYEPNQGIVMQFLESVFGNPVSEDLEEQITETVERAEEKFEESIDEKYSEEAAARRAIENLSPDDSE